MIKLFFPKLIQVLLLLWAVTLACGPAQEEVLVFAASSLTDAMEVIGREFQKTNGIKANFNFAASSTLSQQIDRGAPADVFVAAGVQPVGFLQSEGRIVPGSRVDLLTNRLAVVIKVDKDVVIRSVEDLVGRGYRVAVPDPEVAPAGDYARRALSSLGLWKDMLPYIVFGANVRTTLAYLESDNVDAAIIYVTDAAISDNVQVVVTMPENSHDPILYPAVIVENSSNYFAAEMFLDFLTGKMASNIFLDLGFTPIALR
jgi:molybdate transport system substrate-binding protein